MTDASLSRRDFLRRAAAVGAVTAGGAYLAACGGGATESGAGDAGAEQASALNCADSPDLTDVERQTRTSLMYVEASEKADQNCANCVQFEPGAEGACGKCKVVPGPINPKGHCSVWAAKTT